MSSDERSPDPSTDGDAEDSGNETQSSTTYTGPELGSDPEDPGVELEPSEDELNDDNDDDDIPVLPAYDPFSQQDEGPPATPITFFEAMLSRRCPRTQCAIIERNYHSPDHQERQHAGYQMLRLSMMHELQVQATEYPSFRTQARAVIAAGTTPSVTQLEELNKRLGYFRSVQHMQFILLQCRWLDQHEILVIEPDLLEIPNMLANAVRNRPDYYPSGTRTQTRTQTRTRRTLSPMV